ncbi:hypothetical protein Landi51_06685 [Colletotrichum acutatum]
MSFGGVRESPDMDRDDDTFKGTETQPDNEPQIPISDSSTLAVAAAVRPAPKAVAAVMIKSFWSHRVQALGRSSSGRFECCAVLHGVKAGWVARHNGYKPVPSSSGTTSSSPPPPSISGGGVGTEIARDRESPLDSNAHNGFRPKMLELGALTASIYPSRTFIMASLPPSQHAKFWEDHCIQPDPVIVRTAINRANTI